MSVMEFFTIAEVAERWRVSRMTVYRMVESGSLPSLRIGRSYRLRLQDVERYEREHFTEKRADDE